MAEGGGKDTPKIGYTLCIHIKVSYCPRNASPNTLTSGEEPNTIQFFGSPRKVFDHYQYHIKCRCHFIK